MDDIDEAFERVRSKLALVFEASVSRGHLTEDQADALNELVENADDIDEAEFVRRTEGILCPASDTSART